MAVFVLVLFDIHIEFSDHMCAFCHHMCAFCRRWHVRFLVDCCIYAVYIITRLLLGSNLQFRLLLGVSNKNMLLGGLFTSAV
jgi:hypothetical protein